MAEGAQKERWARTSSMMALIANVNRDTRKRPQPFRPEEFDPFADTGRAEPVVLDRSTIGQLRGTMGK